MQSVGEVPSPSDSVMQWKGEPEFGYLCYPQSKQRPA